MLVRGSDSPATYRLLDVAGGPPVELELAEDGLVTDAAFAPDGRLVLVVRGPLKLPSLDRSDPEATPRRSVLMGCDVAQRSCEVLLRVGGAINGPLLAH